MKHPDFAISQETLDRLRIYQRLVLTWNPTINLVARRDEPVLWNRHVADSLQLVPLIPPRVTSAIDLGSGGGFPGLVLAIATGVTFDLVESDHRKAAFLREAIRATAAPVRVHAARAEFVALAPALLVTSRALAPLHSLLGLAAPLLAPGGSCLFPKGRNAAEELTRAAGRWHMTVVRHPSRTSADATILEISDIAHVGHSG